MNREMNLTAKHHEEDSIEISASGVTLIQAATNGQQYRTFLTHEALHEIMTEVMQWGMDNGLVTAEDLD